MQLFDVGKRFLHLAAVIIMKVNKDAGRCVMCVFAIGSECISATSVRLISQAVGRLVELHVMYASLCEDILHLQCIRRLEFVVGYFEITYDDPKTIPAFTVSGYNYMYYEASINTIQLG